MADCKQSFGKNAHGAHHPYTLYIFFIALDRILFLYKGIPELNNLKTVCASALKNLAS